MKENGTASTSFQRIEVIDALRGFALLGVILMHMLDYFGYTFTSLSNNLSPSVLDIFIDRFSDMMIRGKFISIFSFLFGLSFYIQMERASKKGVDFRSRFLWRMLLLFVIGLIGISFTYLDILTIYALFGVILVFLFPLRNWILMLIVFLIFTGVPNLFIIGFDQIKTERSIFVGDMTLQDKSVVRSEVPKSNDSDNRTKINVFFETTKENLTVRTIDKLKFQFLHTDTGFLVLALFITGFIVGKLHFFEKVHIRKKRNVVLFGAFMVVSLAAVFTARIIEPEEPINLIKLRAGKEDVPLIALLVSSLNNIGTIAMAGALVTGFISLYQVNGARKYLNLLTPYGRMGLTNYEMQNILGAILFSAWGFGSFFGVKGPALLFILGLTIYTLQVVISICWMRQFVYGPLEWLWRSGTYLKWQLFKRNLNPQKMEIVRE
ncbi:MAG: DUF418 domain-containing protein [Porphyromonadaceae bacterium]|nr:DUF418 domain-containing protein [Porphyromonadaceae bacterium]